MIAILDRGGISPWFLSLRNNVQSAKGHNKLIRRKLKQYALPGLALLLLALLWHRTYVPVHLALHEHSYGAITEAQQLHAGDTTNGEEDHEDHHQPHSASDHLAGFLAPGAAPVFEPITITETGRVAPAFSEPIAFFAQPVPGARGPPAA